MHVFVSKIFAIFYGSEDPLMDLKVDVHCKGR